MSIWYRGLVCISIYLISACTSSSLNHTTFAEYQRLQSEQSKNPSTSKLPSRPALATQAIKKILEIKEPTGTLSLQQAIALTMIHNPLISAQTLEIRVAEARMLQATLWPNPEIGVEFEKFSGNREFSGMQSFEIGINLAQTFPLGGDLKKRHTLAWYQRQLINWDYEALRLQTLTTLNQRYIQVLAMEQRFFIARDMLKVAHRLQEAISQNAPPQASDPLLNAQVSAQLSLAKVGINRTKRQFQLAKQQLALMWASKKPKFKKVKGSLYQVNKPPQAEKLIHLVSHNPTVARWATEISARLAAVQVIEAEATPDFTVELGYIYEHADKVVYPVVGVALPLTIFDQRQGDLQAAQLQAVIARRQQKVAELRVESMLSNSYTRLMNAYDEVKQLRDEILPSISNVFEMAKIKVQKDPNFIHEMLGAKRTLLEFKMNYIDALVRYHQALIELESIIGQSIFSL